MADIEREIRHTKEYLSKHPPLITDDLLGREIIRLEAEIALLERLKKLMEEARDEKRLKIDELKAAVLLAES